MYTSLRSGCNIKHLPKIPTGNTHVVVFHDYLTNWPMIFAVPDHKSRRIVYLLVKELVPFFAVPECLLSNWGTNLLSYLIKDVCEALGITKFNTTAYQPSITV